VNCILTAHITPDAIAVTTDYTGTLDFATFNVTGAAAGDFDLNIGTGGEIDLGSGTITCDGHFDWSGATGTVTRGTSTVVLTGTAKELKATYSASPVRTFYQLTIDTGASITLSNDTRTYGLLTINGGLATGAYTILVANGMTQGASGTVSGAGTLSFVYASGKALSFANSSAIAPAILLFDEWFEIPPGTYSPTTQFQIYHRESSGDHTFTWLAGTCTFTSPFIISSNVSGILTVSGTNNPTLIFQDDVTITETAGTIAFSPNSSNANQLTGTGNQTVNLAGKDMGNWIVTKATSGDITWTSGDTITAGGAWSTVNLTVQAGVIIDTGSDQAVTLSGAFDQSSTSSKFLGNASTITINGNGAVTLDGTLDSTQYNDATLVLNGANTLTYDNLASNSSNGFENLTCGQSGNTTTLADNLTVLSVLTVGSGIFTGSTIVVLRGATPLSVDQTNSRISVGSLRFMGNTQTIPALTNGYSCDLLIGANTDTVVTQTGNIAINSTNYLFITGGGDTTRTDGWETDGYDLTVGGNIQVGNGSDTGLKKLDATAGTGGTSTITCGGNWDVKGTGTAPSVFTAEHSTVVFSKASGTQTLNSGDSWFHILRHTGAGILQLTTNAMTTDYLLNLGGAIDTNGQSLREWPWPIQPTVQRTCQSTLCA